MPIHLIRHAEAQRSPLFKEAIPEDFASPEGQLEAKEYFRMLVQQDLGIKAPLTTHGRLQASSISDVLVEPDLVYVSTSPRTYQTAECIFHSRKWENLCMKLQPRASLDELNGGLRDLCLSLEMLFALVPGERERYNDTSEWEYDNCGGESLYQMVQRIEPLAKEIVAIPDSYTVWVVGHGRSLRGILYYLLGWKGPDDWFAFEQEHGNPPLLGRIVLKPRTDGRLGYKIQELSWK